MRFMRKISQKQNNTPHGPHVLDLRNIFLSRTPKWQRKILARKDAEEYLKICRDGICHPAFKQARKTHYFLKWAIKLLVPDFLIGHPNLFDNLKTLFKHPNFKPLRMALVAWLIFSLTTGSLWGILTFRTYAASGHSGFKNCESQNACTGGGTPTSFDSDGNTTLSTERVWLRTTDGSGSVDPGFNYSGGGEGTGNSIEVWLSTTLGTGHGIWAPNVTVTLQYTTDNGTSWSNVAGFPQTVTPTWSGAVAQTSNRVQITATLPTSGDIDKYRIKAESTESGSSDPISVTQEPVQANLKFSVVPTTDAANYNPTATANSITTTVTVTGTITYDNGALPSDYGGTGESVTVTVKDQNTATQQTVTGAIAANGTFSIPFNLPNAAEFGQWTALVGYSHNKDAVTQGSKTFLVNLAFSDVTYQLFQNDVSGGTKETANTGSANMGVPIFITATPFNNPDSDTLDGVKIHWNVPTPPSDVTFSACTTLCAVTTTAPTVAGNAGAGREIEMTGTEQNGTNPAVTVSSSISGFSDRAITLSTTWKYSTVNTAVDNGINTNFSVYNLGETPTSTFYLYNVRDELIKGEAAGTLTLAILKTGDLTETTVSSETVDANGFVDWSYPIGSGHLATNDATGSQKKLKTTDNDGNTVTSGNEWGVSSLLTVDNIWHSKLTSDASEATQFFIGADNMQVKTHVKNVRNENKSSASVYQEVRDPDNTLNTSWTNTSQSDGYTAFQKVIPEAPAGTWSLKASASDSNNNSSATTTETISYVSAYTAKYGIRTVGWNQEYHKGDTATLTIQTLTKNDADDWVATDIDSGTTPYYEIMQWTGSAWATTTARTNMTVKIASSTWEASYAIPNSDAEIGKKYSVSFNARLGGAQVAQLKEFAVVRQVAGDPATVAASPVRANANDTVRLTIREANLDATALTGNAANTQVYIYDPSNALVVNGSNPTNELANGAYYYNYALGASPTNGVYQVVIKVTIGSGTYSAATNFEVNYQPAKESTLTTHETAQSTERNSQATSRTEVSQIKKDVEAGILDAPKTAKSGNTITIKYKAQSGLSGAGAPKLNIYDASNVQRVTDSAMTEIGTTGVYSATATLNAGWGTGFFTVIVSESTNSTSDHTQIYVGASDIQSIGSDVSSIKTTVESTSANVDTLIGAMIVTTGTVNDAAASSTAFITSLTNPTNDFYKNAVLTFTSGILNGQTRRISAYNGTTKIITLDPALTSAPANGVAFTIVKQNVRVEEQVTNVQSDVTTIKSDTAYIRTKADSIYTLLQTVDTNLSSVQATVNSIRTSQQKQYTATLSNVSQVQAGQTYRAKFTLLDFESNPVNASSTPTIVIYDPTRAIAQVTTTMTKLSTGVYEYTYSVSSSATAGLWESVVNTAVGGTADIIRNDYWQVTGSPAQVVINSMSDLTIPSISANVTITNEGGGAFEYQYEWCVVSSQANQCGGDDDIYYASAAKLIQAGDSFNPTLSATVPNTGNYWFKVVVYYGTAASGASQTFTAVKESAVSGGGGGGGGVTPSATHENIYAEIIKARQQLDLNAQKLARTLELLGIINPALQNLLSVNTLNTENLIDIQNKVTDLKAVSSATRRIIEQKAVEPIVETYMKFNSVEINFLITNPSSIRQIVKFKAFLPQEAKPEHILDSSGLKLDYDPNAETYYVFGDIALGPKESVTRKVEIKDIWVFSNEEIKSIKSQAEGLLPALKKTQYEAQGAILKNDIDSTLNIVLLRQEASYSSPQDHIVAYRENKERVTRVENNLEKLKDLVVQAGASQGVVGKVGGIQTFATWGIILAIVFGFGLLAAVIFAMWRHQMTFAATTMGLDKEILAELDRKRRKKKIIRKEILKSEALGIKRAKIGKQIMLRLPSVNLSFVWRLPWRKILIWVAIVGFVLILGIVTIKFMPGLFRAREVKFGEQKMPAAVPITSPEKMIESDAIQKTQESATIEVSNPKLKILDTPTGWLNVRDSASLKGKILTKVYSGEQYEYTKQENGWYYITIPKSKSGWVFGEYVQELKN